MAKDYVGINNCIRDIFQGPDTCGHEYELVGFDDLNTAGFNRSQPGVTGNGVKAAQIKIDDLTNVANGNAFYIDLTGSSGNEVRVVFEVTSNAAPSDLTRVKITKPSSTATPANRKTLSDNILSAITNFFQFKLRQTTSTGAWVVSVTDFEHGSENIDIGMISGGAPNFNVSIQNQTSTGHWHNDLPRYFTPSWAVLNMLNLHRNGAYGFCSWKQIRNHDKPLVKHLRQNNKMTFVTPAKIKKVTLSSVLSAGTKNKTLTINPRHGGLVCMDEPCIISKHYPLKYNVGRVMVLNRRASMNRFSLKTSYNNNTTFFSNERTNHSHNVPKVHDENYKFFKDMYVDGAMDSDGSPIDEFEFMKFRQTVYPKEKLTFKSFIRVRKYFVSGFWKTLRDERNVALKEIRQLPSFAWYTPATDGFGNYEPNTGGYFPSESPIDLFMSHWPLDASHDFAEAPKTCNERIGWNHRATSSAGILQNCYSQVAQSSSVANGFGFKVGLLNEYLRPAPYYSRKHTNVVTGSPVTNYPHLNPTGPNLRGLGVFTEQPAQSGIWPSRFGGETYWDCPTQAKKEPFPNSIEDFYENTRPVFKDYTIVPEFKISDHVEFYDTNGIKEENPRLFDLPGCQPHSGHSAGYWQTAAIPATTEATSSTSEDFYKIFSTTDLLKNFDILVDDHRDFVQPSVISLSCKAVKKLVPYKGFYPVQRTVQMAEQFFESYKDYISYSSGSAVAFGQTLGERIGYDSKKHVVQNILTPLFAPGILYNTIKSGVACDWPQMTNFDNSSGVHGTLFKQYDDDYGGGDRMIANPYFSERIPFEALVNPAKHLAEKMIFCMEPDLSGALPFSSVWTGEGDDLYVKMMNNFLAEVPTFFLNKEELTHFSSLPQSSPNFGNATAGKTYVMRVKMFRSMNQAKNAVKPRWFTSTNINAISASVDFGGHNANVEHIVPQDIANGSLRETITMYSRPSAFGPPSFGLNYQCHPSQSALGETEDYWSSGFAPHMPDDRTRRTAGTLAIANDFILAKDSHDGYNFPFTPPYYHGQAWADITFTATETKKYSLAEIMNSCSVEYTRYDRTPHYSTGSCTREASGRQTISQENAGSLVMVRMAELTPVNDPLDMTTATLLGPQSMHQDRINKNAMQLSCSVNLFGKGQLKRVEKSSNKIGELTDTVSTVIDTVDDAKSRWVIQTKFETPVLDFSEYTAVEGSDWAAQGLTMPAFDGSKSTGIDPKLVSRGMWHQYGKIPSAKNKGIFMQITDIPHSWFRGTMNMSASVLNKNYRSLADLVGFSSKRKKLGKLAMAKKISEAVVAVPFVEKSGQRQFFRIPRRDIENVLMKRKVDIAGESVRDMIMKMQKYVFPPSMDFIKYDSVDPFAMYIFEFEHVLSQQDLADIWQGLAPDISSQHETATATITHELLANELLGGGAKVINTDDGVVIDERTHGPSLNTKIKWMVFKVKQKAKTQYEEVIISKKGTINEKFFGTPAVKNTEDDIEREEITYNWPYDYFSLVELAKIDAEVEFSEIEKDEKTKSRKVKKKIAKKKKMKKNFRNILFGEDATNAEADEESINNLFEEPCE